MTRIRKSGGYRKLASFQTATIIYDATVWFCEKFLDERKTRTVDQMIQAARSGRQNIAEGSRAAATSSQTELRLVNVARASLEELLLDYEDFLRHRRLPLWAPGSPEATAVRSVASNWKKLNPSDPSDPSDRKLDPSDRSAPSDRKLDRSDPSNPSNHNLDPTDLIDLTDQARWALYAPWLEHADPAIRANAMICLIHQANFLLDQQIDALERQFIDDGGYSEQLATARLQKRNQTRSPAKPEAAPNCEPSTFDSQTTDTIPKCPECGSLMTLRTAKTGRNPGSQFWGCTQYPQCKGIISV